MTQKSSNLTSVQENTKFVEFEPAWFQGNPLQLEGVLIQGHYGAFEHRVSGRLVLVREDGINSLYVVLLPVGHEFFGAWVYMYEIDEVDLITLRSPGFLVDE